MYFEALKHLFGFVPLLKTMHFCRHFYVSLSGQNRPECVVLRGPALKTDIIHVRIVQMKSFQSVKTFKSLELSYQISPSIITLYVGVIKRWINACHAL